MRDEKGSWKRGRIEVDRHTLNPSVVLTAFVPEVGGFFEGFWSDSTTVAALATPHDFLHCSEESCSHCGAQCYTWGPSQTATGSHTSKGHTRKT